MKQIHSNADVNLRSPQESSPVDHRAGHLLVIALAFVLSFSATNAWADEKQADSIDGYELSLRSRHLEPDGWVRIQLDRQQWKPEETAIIVCDMWDAHHCLNAVRRVQQLAPRIDALLRAARSAGSTIVHAPSSCMEFYESHPARQRARAIPRAASTPEEIGSWCHWKNDKEESIGYPIDHSDGGEDDDPREHQAWQEKLKAMGRDPQRPWIRQIETIHIDDSDYITDDGVENWSILEQNGIRNVMLVGVHTNMCVLGRPFGLRQLSRNDKNVVLVRDLTDTMYNPEMPPYVNHFSGTDLVVEHIEQYVCPTITSDQILGGSPLRFRNDHRPHIVMLIGEREYKTRVTLPKFAKRHLYKDYRVSLVFADDQDRNHFESIESVRDADLLLVSVRRRAPPVDQLAIVRQHVEQGKPVVGIRTASHAFSLRGKESPAGHAVWPEFDADVFGGNYHGHHSNKGNAAARTYVWSVAPHDSKIMAETGLQTEQVTTAWLYKTSPLKPGTRILMMGRVGDRLPHEPVSWTFIHSGNGRSFYTSLGHPDDFQDKSFQTLLNNGIDWSLQRVGATQAEH